MQCGLALYFKHQNTVSISVEDLEGRTIQCNESLGKKIAGQSKAWVGKGGKGEEVVVVVV